MLLVEDRGGKLYLEPATAVPVRDIPKATLQGWIKDDETAMNAFKKSAKQVDLFLKIPAFCCLPAPLRRVRVDSSSKKQRLRVGN